MKKLLAIGLVVGLLSIPAFAVQKKASVTTNPFSLMLGIMGAEGNFAVGESVSMPASFAYFSRENDGSSGKTEASILQLGTGLRYYWQGTAVNGWYLGGTLNYNIVSIDYTEDITGLTGSASAGAVSYGFLIGYQAIWEGGFTLDSGLGMAKYTIPSVEVDLENSVTADSYGFSFTLPQIKLAIGYAF